MIDSKVGLQCTGCTACDNSCPYNAITMTADREGFLYPKINYQKCVKCGLCVKKCPVLNDYSSSEYLAPEVYAAWNLDSTIRINSTSGGVFSALAKAIIEKEGYVVGAYYNEDFQICHMIINQVDEIEKLRQSKYAQSDLGHIFKEIKKLLNQGELVLFCGSPCQSVGLQNYLAKSYKTLYCCDFICRGVISSKVYMKFLNDMRPETQVSVKKVHFKNKDFGWNNFSTCLTFDDDTFYQKNRDEDYYMRGYLKHNLYLRPACHTCHFKTLPRQSDISLGDFWGIGRYKADLDDNRGTSVILINSKKGQELFQWIQEQLYFEKRNLNEVLAGNSCLLNSAEKGKYREYFFDNMDKYSFVELIEMIDKKTLNLSTREKILMILHDVKVRLLRKKDE